MSNDFLPAAHQRNDDGSSAVLQDVELPDMVLVNPGGRVVEVTGELGQQLLLENGYRRATEAEAKQIEDYKRRTHPELLRRQEVRRARDERSAVDDLEKELAAEDSKPKTTSKPNNSAGGHKTTLDEQKGPQEPRLNPSDSQSTLTAPADNKPKPRG